MFSFSVTSSSPGPFWGYFTSAMSMSAPWCHSLPSTKGRTRGITLTPARRSSPAKSTHQIYHRLLEAERQTPAAQGSVLGTTAAAGFARFPSGELLSLCFPSSPIAGWLLPSVAGQGIAGKLHTGKKSQK